MQTLTLLAVDEPQTICREDGFLLETSTEGSAKRLIVASTIPPKTAYVHYGPFLRNVYQQRGESPEYFLEKKDRLEFGLKTATPKQVLMAIFEFDKNDNFFIKISTGLAVIKSLTYDEFLSSKDFEKTRESVEEFIFQDYHADWGYRTGNGESLWIKGATPARRLIAAIMGMFNHAISQYAHNEKLQTFKLTKQGLQFKVHDGARFRSPLRMAVSFVNTLNIVASIQGNPPPYHQKRLQEIFGKGYPIKT